MRFSLKAILLPLLISVLFPLTSLASEMGVTQEEFIERYTKAVEDYNTSYAAVEGLQEKKTIKKEQLFITRYSPNNVLEIIINGASAFKDPMGNMILLTDDSTQFSNSEITLDVAMALYAFDPTFQEVRQATQLYVDLSHSKTGTISHGDVDYTILNQNGTMLQIEAVYRGYTPILGITPTPSPEDEAKEAEEADSESEDTESADAADASDTGSEEDSSGQDAGTAEDSSGQDAGTAENSSDQDAGTAEAAPTPTPVASVLVYPGGNPSSDSGAETSPDSDPEDSSDTEGSRNEDDEASSDSDTDDSGKPEDEASGESNADDSGKPDDKASGDSDADDSGKPDDKASGDSDADDSGKPDNEASPTPTPKITITPGITALPTLTPSATPTPRPSVKPPMAARPSVTPVPSPLPSRRQ